MASSVGWKPQEHHVLEQIGGTSVPPALKRSNKMANTNFPLKSKWTEKLHYFMSPMSHCLVRQCLMTQQTYKFNFSNLIFFHLKLRTKLFRKLTFLLTWRKMLSIFFLIPQINKAWPKKPYALLPQWRHFLQARYSLIA